MSHFLILMLDVIMPSVVMLSVIMPSAMAPVTVLEVMKLWSIELDMYFLICLKGKVEPNRYYQS